MKIILPTDSQLRVINVGKTSPTQHFSAVFPSNETKAQSLVSTYKGTRDVFACSVTLFSHEVPHQFIVPIDTGDKVTMMVLTNAILDPADSGFVLGSLSDTIGQPQPVRLRRSFFLSSFTSLAPRGQLEVQGFPKLDKAPDTVEILDSDDTHSMESLHWTLTGVPNIPAFGLFPQIFPLPPGHNLPSEMLLTYTPPVGPSLQDFGIWIKALAYVVEHNAKFSITEGGPLMSPLEFTAEDRMAFAGYTIGNLPCLDLAEIQTLSSFGPTSAAYRLITAEVEALSHGAWYILGHTMAPPDLPMAPPAANPLAPQVLEIKWQDQMPPSKSDKEQMDHAADVAFKYRIAWGRIEAGTFIPATLVPSLITILSKSNKPAALRLAQEDVKTVAFEYSTKDTKVAAFVNLTKDHVTSGMVTGLRNFQFFFGGMPMTDLPAFQRELSPANFLPIDKGSSQYFTVTKETAALLEHEYATQDTKSQPKGGLYVGRLASIKDIHHMIANWMAISGKWSPEFDTSTMRLKLQEYLDILLSPKATQWFDLYDKTNPALRVNILQDVVQIVGGFLEAGDHHWNVQHLRDGNTLDPAVFDNAIAGADGITARLFNAIAVQQLLTYSHEPTELMQHFGMATQTTPAKQLPSKQAGRQVTPSSASDSNKKQRVDPEPKGKGLLVFTGIKQGNRLPFLGIRAKKTAASKSEEQLCPWFLVTDHTCTNPKCPRPHIHSLSQLDAGKRAELCAKINDPLTPYTWAPGRAPAPGNA